MFKSFGIALAVALATLAFPAQAETMTVAQTRCDDTTCITTYSEYIWNPLLKQWSLVSIKTVTIQRSNKLE